MSAIAHCKRAAKDIQLMLMGIQSHALARLDTASGRERTNLNISPSVTIANVELRRWIGRKKLHTPTLEVFEKAVRENGMLIKKTAAGYIVTLPYLGHCDAYPSLEALYSMSPIHGRTRLGHVHDMPVYL